MNKYTKRILIVIICFILGFFMLQYLLSNANHIKTDEVIIKQEQID